MKRALKVGIVVMTWVLAARAELLVGTVSVGSAPCAAAVNTITNRVYVASRGSNTVTVIDALTGRDSTLVVGSEPCAVAANPFTNRIYVANRGDNSVTVINGMNHTQTRVTVGQAPCAIAVSALTGAVYVADSASNLVTKIYGPAHTTKHIAVGQGPRALAVNSTNGKVYVVNAADSSLSIIDAVTDVAVTSPLFGRPWSVATNPVTKRAYITNSGTTYITTVDSLNRMNTIMLAFRPEAIAVNPVTNRIFAVGRTDGRLAVIDGATHSTNHYSVAYAPTALAVNALTNRVYIADSAGDRVVAFDCLTGTTTQTLTGLGPVALAVNPVTNRVHVVSRASSTVAIVSGVACRTNPVNVGAGPTAVAVNPLTDSIFVANRTANSVTVIQGRTNMTSSILVGLNPAALAVNPVTNRIYVANSGDNNVTVIEGATGVTRTVNAGAFPCAVAVNPVTNRVYIANRDGNSVTEIDGPTRDTTLIPVGAGPCALAVNPVTNRIYVANCGAATVTVINGESRTTTSVPVGRGPCAVAVNDRTDVIYVANDSSAAVTVIDGPTNMTQTVPVSTNPRALAVNPTTGHVYVANYGRGTISVITPTLGVYSVLAGSGPVSVAVNPVTNKVYAANRTGATMTQVDDVAKMTASLPIGTEPAAVAVNPVTGRVYIACYAANQVAVISDNPLNDTKLAIQLSTPPCCTTSLARPVITGRALSVSTPYRTRLMTAAARLGSAQRNWDTVRVTGASAGRDTLNWSLLWGADSLRQGENLVCLQPLTTDAAGTGNVGPGSALAGNLRVAPLYRLPLSTRDVAVTAIIRPDTIVSAGTSVIPRCRLVNYSPVNVTYQVTLAITDGYRAEAIVRNHQPGTTVEATFAPWVARQIGDYRVTVITGLTGDYNPSNDTLSRLTRVPAHDIGVVMIVRPESAIAAGPVAPQALIRNFAIAVEPFAAFFRIPGTAYNEIVIFPEGLARYTDTLLTFPSWDAVPGTYQARCSVYMAWDNAPANDIVVQDFRVGRPDAGVARITAPLGLLDSSVTVTPSVMVRNYGELTTFVPVDLRIDYGGSNRYNERVTITGLRPGDSALAVFPEWSKPHLPGDYAVASQTALPGDMNPANDTARAAFRVGRRDVGVVSITAPLGLLDTTSTIVPAARVLNSGELAADFRVHFRIDSAGLNLYTDEVAVTGLATGESLSVSFAEWPLPHRPGIYTTGCRTILAADVNPANDSAAGRFEIAGPFRGLGWQRMRDIPLGPRNKRVKDGGSLAHISGTTAEASGGAVYALKGNGTYEVYRYNIATDTWTPHDSVPAVGRAGRKKPVKKGGALTTEGFYLYAFKGNGTSELWRGTPGEETASASGTSAATALEPSDPRTLSPNSWVQLADVPAGSRTVRDGAATTTVWVGGRPYIYLLKGSGTYEFYRFDIQYNTWQTLATAPVGPSGKAFKTGSCITSDDQGHIYALKGSYNELFRYNVASNTWDTLRVLPFIGALGKKKKVKEGAALVAHGDTLYALKGGNTQELWKYCLDSSRWLQAEDLPIGGGKRVRAGGSMLYAPGPNVLYALKGNSTFEFWQYLFPNLVSHSQATAGGRQSMTAGGEHRTAARLQVNPNPVQTGSRITLSLPTAGPVRLNLYTLTGARAATLKNGWSPAGDHTFHVPTLTRGIYLLRLNTNRDVAILKLTVD